MFWGFWDLLYLCCLKSQQIRNAEIRVVEKNSHILSGTEIRKGSFSGSSFRLLESSDLWLMSE